ELLELFRGYGYAPVIVSGGFDDEPSFDVHQRFAAALDAALDEIARIKAAETDERPRWPMLILRTPKGWTGPKEWHGVPIENTWRAHQVPLGDVRGDDEKLRALEDWMRSYRPEELFDEAGALRPELAELPPRGERRMSANP